MRMSIKKRRITGKNMGKNKQTIRRTERASVTVETSLILFLFMMFFICMMYFYIILNLEIKIQTALEQTADTQAAYAAVSNYHDGKGSFSYIQCGLDQAFAKANVIRLTGKNYLDNSWIKGGSSGLSFLKSSFLKDGVTLSLVVSYKIKIPFFSVLDINIEQRAYRRVWYGEDTSNLKNVKNKQDTVYITESGVVYHLYEDCDYIDVKLRAVKGTEVSSLRNVDGCLYYPCESCKPDTKGTVYITSYGTRYHKSQECSAIEKHPMQISVDDTGNRDLCSKCEKKAEMEDG